MGTETVTPLPEPPNLGSLPKGTRGRALLLSAAIYGGLVSGAMSLLVASAPQVMAKRTFAVALDDFDAFAAAPPPAGPSGSSSAPMALVPQAEAVVPSAPSEASAPLVQAPVVPASMGAGTGEVADGVPGGQPGGVAGGQVGGGAGGQGGAVLAPRFDAAYLQNPEPEYPNLSKRLGEEGRVILRVLVNPEGLADQVEIRQSSGHSRLDQAALGTVRRWRFIPARRGPERLAAWVLVPLSFQLDA
ncbi:MAG TPA: energy transducer TonB [Holophagaceae bacterium]|nr:energy transducer TonB [Holophagaceae bacterium]